MHHYYKSPQPFDDMYIHPLEAAGYYCILYSPAFIFRMHWIGFAVYMAIMGTCGVLDHCGIQVCDHTDSSTAINEAPLEASIACT